MVGGLTYLFDELGLANETNFASSLIADFLKKMVAEMVADDKSSFHYFSFILDFNVSDFTSNTHNTTI